MSRPVRPRLPRELGNEVIFNIIKTATEWSDENYQMAMLALTTLMSIEVPHPNHKGDQVKLSVLIASAMGHKNTCHHCAWECDLCTPETCGNCDCLYR